MVDFVFYVSNHHIKWYNCIVRYIYGRCIFYPILMFLSMILHFYKEDFFMRRRISTLLIIIMCFLSLSSPVLAQGYQREITGEFSNIEVRVNNHLLGLYKEPFIYEGEVYLPLNNLSQFLYIDSKYDESNGNLSINTGNLLKGSNTKDFIGKLLQKDYEISVLTQELREEEKKLERKTQYPYKKINNIKDMENYLEEHFGKLRGIPMTMDFRQYSGSRYRLYITIPSEDRRDFEDISKRVVEDYLLDILYATRELYDYSARIDGYIRDDASSYRTYLSFESYGSDMDFSFRNYSSSNNTRININEKDLEKHLDKYISTYNGVDFTYDAVANRYDVDLTVYFKDEDYYNWNSSRQKNYLDRLQKEIKDFKGNLDVYGKIVDDRDNKEVSRFYFLDNNVDYYEDVYRGRSKVVEEIKEEFVTKNPSIKRNLIAWIPNITLTIDGVPFNLLKDVLVVGDEVYIAISDIGDALYWIVEYIPEESQLNIIDNNFISQQSIQSRSQLLQDKDLEKEKLLTDLEILKEDVIKSEKTYIPYGSIRTVSSMQSYLRDEFEDFEGIEMYIRLSHSKNNDYRLNITYPKEDYHIFDDIKGSKIEGWVEEMFDSIRDLYDTNATIRGYIRNDSSGNLTYITFDTDSRDRLTFDFEDHGNKQTSSKNIEAREIERVLDRYLRRYKGANFRYEVIINRRDVDLNIHCTNDRFYRWDLDDKMDYLRELKKEIYDVYEDININGRLFDNSREDHSLKFSIERGQIRSFDLMEETEKYLKKNYGDFSYGDLNFTYSIHEKSNSFDIIMEGDFFEEENSWRGIESDDDRLGEFKNFVRDVKDFVEDFWDIDVKVEVVDKAYSSLIIK